MPLLVFIVPCVTDWVCVWSRTILFHMSGRAYIYNLIQTFLVGVLMSLWSHFQLLKCILYVCVPQGFNQMYRDNLSCSALTAPSKTEGLILHQWWLRKGRICVCVWERGSVCNREMWKWKKGQKTAWKEQYRYYCIKSGNGSRLSHNISISKRWNICESFSALLTLQNWV